MSKWAVATLGDLVDFGFGKTPPRADGRFWAAEGGHAWATIADLRHDPVMSTTERVSDAGLPFAGRRVPAGGVMMSFKLTVGRVARAGVDLLTNEAIVSITGRPGVADDRWLYHALPAIASGGVTDTAVKGATLNKRKLERLWVAVPPLEEQRRIAEILDTIDEAIQASERVIAKLEFLHEGTVDSLVGPATRPHEAPPEWARGCVLDFLHLQRGFDITKDAQHAGRVPVVSSSGISSYHDEARVCGPGVVTGRKGKLGTAYYVEDDFWPHDTALWVADFKGNDPQFVALFLNTLRLERLDAATSVPTLNRNVVHPLPAAFPPLEDQRQIVSAFTTGRAHVRAERDCLRKLQATRSGLAADLLSGRVRTAAA